MSRGIREYDFNYGNEGPSPEKKNLDDAAVAIFNNLIEIDAIKLPEPRTIQICDVHKSVKEDQNFHECHYAINNCEGKLCKFTTYIKVFDK